MKRGETVVERTRFGAVLFPCVHRWSNTTRNTKANSSNRRSDAPDGGLRFSRFHSLRSEVAMSIFSYRKHLRFLSQTQRRRWWDQKKRLTPRIVIGAAYVPPNVTREFAYIKVG
jgi:hypothetical protein